MGIAFFVSFVSAGKGDYDSTFGDEGGGSYDIPSGNGGKIVWTPSVWFSSSSKSKVTAVKWTQEWAEQKNSSNTASEKKQETTPVQEKKTQNQTQQSAGAEVGINVDPDCLVNGGCSFSIYDALDIRNDREAGERTSVMTFVNDIILGLTWFIGTVVAVSLILSGFYYIISPVDSGAKKKAMEGIKYSLIGMVIVSLSVVIVRLIQFLASGGS